MLEVCGAWILGLLVLYRANRAAQCLFRRSDHVPRDDCKWCEELNWWTGYELVMIFVCFGVALSRPQLISEMGLSSCPLVPDPLRVGCSTGS